MAIALGSVIGVGVFRTTGQVLRGAGSIAAALGVWLGVGAVCLVGAWMYADLSTRVPEAGGPYAYVRESYGRFAAFVDGWLAAGLSIPVRQAAGLAVMGELLHERIAVSPRIMSLVVLVVLTVLNLFGVRAGALSQRAFTALKILAVVSVIALAVWPASHHGAVSSSSLPPLSLLGAVSAAWYTYLGWQDIALLSEEIREPRRDLPFVLVSTVLIVAGLYLALNVALYWALRDDAALYGNFPALALARQRLGAGGEALVSVAVLTSMLGGAAESLMVRPRVAFSLARDGFAPAVLASVNRAGTPAGALIFHSVVVAGLVLSGSFERLLGLLVLSQALTSLLEALSYFPLRKRIAGPTYTPLHPWVPASFVAMNAILCVWIAWQEPRQLVYAAGMIAIAVVSYAVVMPGGLRQSMFARR